MSNNCEWRRILPPPFLMSIIWLFFFFLSKHKFQWEWLQFWCKLFFFSLTTQSETTDGLSKISFFCVCRTIKLTNVDSNYFRFVSFKATKKWKTETCKWDFFRPQLHIFILNGKKKNKLCVKWTLVVSSFQNEKYLNYCSQKAFWCVQSREPHHCWFARNRPHFILLSTLLNVFTMIVAAKFCTDGERTGSECVKPCRAVPKKCGCAYFCHSVVYRASKMRFSAIYYPNSQQSMSHKYASIWRC